MDKFINRQYATDFNKEISRKSDPLLLEALHVSQQIKRDLLEPGQLSEIIYKKIIKPQE